jgi:hypothetical protein
MTITIQSSWHEILADPDRFQKELSAGKVIELIDIGVTLARTEDLPAIADELAEEGELLGDMASLLKESTGVDNTIFVSTKGSARHAARIKIAIDPPDSFNAATKTASMAIHDFSISGAFVPTHIAEQAKKFIDLNREVLLLYWEAKIGTKEMISRLKIAPP